MIESVQNGNNELSYEYDDLGNISSITENNTLINEYEYDSLNQLIEDSDHKNNKKYINTYDNGGNLLTKVIKNLTSGTTIDTITYTYGNNNWKDQLTSYNGNSITYDQIGNPTSISNDIDLTWTNGRQLQRYQDSTNNLDITYNYNEEGIRTSKVINNITTNYYLEGTYIIYEDRNGTSIYYLYDNSGVSGFEYNNNTYYFVKNLQGDIIEILDDSFNTVAKYSYDVWGNHISITDGNDNDVSSNSSHIANINPFRYRSYYFDSESNLYYLNARYYNGEWGRFINSDQILGANQDLLAFNLYAYVSNNSVNNYDPTGVAAQKSLPNASTPNFKIWNTIITINTPQGKATIDLNKIPVKEFVHATLSSSYQNNSEELNSVFTHFMINTSLSNMMFCQDYSKLMYSTLSWVAQQNAIDAIHNKASGSIPVVDIGSTGTITGYTKHGIDNAISKNGVGIKPSSILDTVNNPISRKYQYSTDTYKYTGYQGVVVLNRYGQVVTTWSRGSQFWR